MPEINFTCRLQRRFTGTVFHYVMMDQVSYNMWCSARRLGTESVFQESDDKFRTTYRRGWTVLCWFGEGSEFKDCDGGSGTMYVWRGVIGDSRFYNLNQTNEVKYLHGCPRRKLDRVSKLPVTERCWLLRYWNVWIGSRRLMHGSWHSLKEVNALGARHR